jgi:hypothetical protein
MRKWKLDIKATQDGAGSSLTLPSQLLLPTEGMKRSVKEINNNKKIA